MKTKLKRRSKKRELDEEWKKEQTEGAKKWQEIDGKEKWGKSEQSQWQETMETIKKHRDDHEN